jgi:organic radical activating enzyme
LKSEVKESNAHIAALSGEKLPFMEDFYTLQGEGFHTGKPAYFVRIGGCDVGCHWCDVKESWDARLHPLTDVHEVIERAQQTGCKTMVVTGGEPLQYNLDYFTSELKKKGFAIHLETSGAFPLSGHWDWICLSPKKQQAPLPELFQAAHELKVIIHNKDDFKWAEENARKVNGIPMFLQPEWSKIKDLMPKIVEYVLQNKHWRISLQSHKYMNIP